jgi:mRNA-degrading endonuclease RelE of RelBE toxin-antitoxin system
MGFFRKKYPPLAYTYLVELVETSVFTGQIAELLDEETYRQFQIRLAESPAMGPLIRSGGGIRKVRVAMEGRGKRGGARVIYYWAVNHDRILLLFCYAKNESADLTPRQVAQLARIVREEYGYESRDV